MIAVSTNTFQPVPQSTALLTRTQIKKARFLSVSDQFVNKGENGDVETTYDVSIPPPILHLLPENH